MFLIKLNEEVTEMAQRIKQTRPLVEEVAAHIRELIDKSALGSFTLLVAAYVRSAMH